MRINNLELTDFRNYNHFFIEFDQGINILIGGNAQGKTNIIEAIYLLSVCKSFRTHINDQMIRFDHDFAKVKGNVFSNERMHQLELILSKESKKAKVDGKDILKISDYVGYLNAVVFVPDDLSLVKGSPSIRRKFLDLELSKISPIYVFYLTKYNRLLKERNQYLKLLNQRRGKYDEYLETLDEQLAEVQIKIIEKRNNFIERLSLKVKDIYLNIANCNEIVELQYECFIKKVNKEDMKNFDAAKIEYARLAIKAASVADARKVPEGYTSDDIKKFVTEAREVVDSYLSADQTSMVPNYADLTELEKEYTSTGGSGGSDEEVSVPMC